MHIFFSGIGGTGIGPLALIAKEAGYTVSGSDKQESQYITYLRSHGITDVHIGQTTEAIAARHEKNPIDWYVYSSALPKENPDHPELVYVRSQHIKHSKRDELLNTIIEEKHLKLVAVAGTHGKSTTTAMTIWLCQQLQLPLSYSLGAKISFGDMGQFDPASQYFVYECDEFDRNFLAFKPYVSIISGIAWDHHEIYPTEQEYNDAFGEFLNQSDHRIIWQNDYSALKLTNDTNYSVLGDSDQGYEKLTLIGTVNRRDAWLAITAVHWLTSEPLDTLIRLANAFPGLSRRMEQIAPGLYSDYAHTPEKIAGAMGIALETAAQKQQKIVVVYEPLTNRRMHYTAEQHADIFTGASTIYWVPSYLAREDPNQLILRPKDLIKSLNPDLQSIAEPMELSTELKDKIKKHLQDGDLVVGMSGGGGNSLDEWLRKEFA